MYATDAFGDLEPSDFIHVHSKAQRCLAFHV